MHKTIDIDQVIDSQLISAVDKAVDLADEAYRDAGNYEARMGRFSETLRVKIEEALQSRLTLRAELRKQRLNISDTQGLNKLKR